MNVPKRVLVLDDDARVRQLIELALRPPDFKVHGFADGRDALMRLHEISPDLILSDIWMPDMDGRTFFRVVKRSQALNRVPFIFLSAVRPGPALEALLQAGVDSFLLKPFPLSLLRERVRSVLGMSPESAPGRTIAEASPSYALGVHRYPGA